MSKKMSPNIHELARIFKALSDPNRLAILQMLRQECGGSCRFDAGSTVGEIAEEFDIALSTVSHHIKELRTAGLIVCEKKGQWVCCSANPGVLEKMRAFLEVGLSEEVGS